MKNVFIVASQGRNFRFTPEAVGYSVTEVGVRGVNTQGDTFEEALANAHSASTEMAKFRFELEAEALAKSTQAKRGRRRRLAIAGDPSA